MPTGGTGTVDYGAILTQVLSFLATGSTTSYTPK